VFTIAASNCRTIRVSKADECSDREERGDQ
jgi:hypothetical protein